MMKSRLVNIAEEVHERIEVKISFLLDVSTQRIQISDERNPRWHVGGQVSNRLSVEMGTTTIIFYLPHLGFLLDYWSPLVYFFLLNCLDVIGIENSFGSCWNCRLCFIYHFGSWCRCSRCWKWWSCIGFSFDSDRCINTVFNTIFIDIKVKSKFWE